MKTPWNKYFEYKKRTRKEEQEARKLNLEREARQKADSKRAMDIYDDLIVKLWNIKTIKDLGLLEAEWIHMGIKEGLSYELEEFKDRIVDKRKQLKHDLIIKFLVLLEDNESKLINIDFLAGLLVGELLYDKDPDLKWLAKKLLVVTNERKY